MKPISSTHCKDCKSLCCSILKDLNVADLDKLYAIKQQHVYTKGDVFFTEGSYPRGLFCVQSGKIKVSQLGIDGKEQIVHLIHDGNSMGHRAILGEDVFSCSAVAMEDSTVCFIPKTPFYTMVESNAKLALTIAHLLAKELREAERNITDIAQRPVKNRLALSLLNLHRNYGYAADNATINLTVKREELANLTGTTRETATRLLYELQEQQIITLEGKKIKILNLNLLREIAAQTA